MLDHGLSLAGIYLMAPALRIGTDADADNSQAGYLKLVAPRLGNGVGTYVQFYLDDKVEQDDNCARVYNKSLLYLVSNACEHVHGTPILGMEKYAAPLAASKPDGMKVWDWIKSPSDKSKAIHHGGFGDDPTTIKSILDFIKPERLDLLELPEGAV